MSGSDGTSGVERECLDSARIRLLDEVLSRIGAGTAPTLVCVQGEPGHGKTTMLAAVGAGAALRGRAPVVMQGTACAGALPHAGLLDLLTGASPAQDGRATAELVARLTSFTPTTSALAVACAIGTWLGHDLDLQPVVIVDDADLVDEESLRILTFAAGRLVGGSAALVFGTTRPVSLLERLRVPRLRLDDLTRDEAIGWAIRSGAAEAPAVRLADRLGGNPLALEHAARAFPVGSARMWPSEPPVPQRLCAEVEGRMDGLPRSARRLMEAAAVTGVDRLELLNPGWPSSDHLPSDVLDKIEDTGLVEADGGHLRWRRAWMAAAVAQCCSPSRRTRITEEIRTQTARTVGGRPEALLPRPTSAATREAARPGRRPAVRGQLTVSERRVVDVVAAGASTRDAARHLCISERTVSTHLQSAYRKLGVQSRSQLTAMMLSGRLLWDASSPSPASGTT